MTTDTTRTVVEATAKELRERGTEINPVNVADMLLALLARAESAEAERDEARVQSKRAGEIGLAKWKEGIDRAATARAELAAAGETIAAVTKQREDADHDADLARSQLGSVAMDNADLRATIARLTAEVQAARKTTTFIETADGVYAVSIGTPKFCLLAKDYASAKERANEAREFAARARTNPKEPTT